MKKCFIFKEEKDGKQYDADPWGCIMYHGRREYEGKYQHDPFVKPEKSEGRGYSEIWKDSRERDLGDRDRFDRIVYPAVRWYGTVEKRGHDPGPGCRSGSYRIWADQIQQRIVLKPKHGVLYLDFRAKKV